MHLSLVRISVRIFDLCILYIFSVYFVFRVLQYRFFYIIDPDFDNSDLHDNII